jgi:hypothetical protein
MARFAGLAHAARCLCTPARTRESPAGTFASFWPAAIATVATEFAAAKEEFVASAKRAIEDLGAIRRRL